MADETRDSGNTDAPGTAGKAATGNDGGGSTAKPQSERKQAADKTAAGAAKASARKTGSASASRSTPSSGAAKSRPSRAKSTSARKPAAAKSASSTRKTAKPSATTGAAAKDAAGNAGPTAQPTTDLNEHAGRHWLNFLWRAIALIGFGVVSWFVLLAGWAIAALQFVVNLLRDEPNAQLHDVNARLGLYLKEILTYMGGDQSTDRLPFPFSEFPDNAPRNRSK